MTKRRTKNVTILDQVTKRLSTPFCLIYQRIKDLERKNSDSCHFHRLGHSFIRGIQSTKETAPYEHRAKHDITERSITIGFFCLPLFVFQAAYKLRNSSSNFEEISMHIPWYWKKRCVTFSILQFQLTYPNWNSWKQLERIPKKEYLISYNFFKKHLKLQMHIKIISILLRI